MIEALKQHSSHNIGIGVSKAQIGDLEARLDFSLPNDFQRIFVQIELC